MRMEVLAYEHSGGWDKAWPAVSDPDRTLLLVFGASDRYLADPDPLRTLRDAYPKATLAGCSTAGEIHGDAVRDESLSVAVAEFDSTELQTVAVQCATSEDSFGAGHRLAEALDGPDLAGVLLLSDGLHVNGSELVRGIAGRLGREIPVTGGLAGDAERFSHTWVLADGEPSEGFCSAVGFYGPSLEYRHGSQGGWNIFGPERLITHSDGNILYELDGKPALELYRDYLGELADGLPATGLLFPLAVRQGPERYLVRTILAIDEERQALVFAGDVPADRPAQLMQANFDRLVGGAEAAAEQARTDGRPVLAIAISCVGRRLVLGERTDEEVEATLNRLPPGSRQVGFYSYGEISPYTDGTCDLHNQTMTLTTIAERT